MIIGEPKGGTDHLAGAPQGGFAADQHREFRRE
jgi:hypothetical protein